DAAGPGKEVRDGDSREQMPARTTAGDGHSWHCLVGRHQVVLGTASSSISTEFFFAVPPARRAMLKSRPTHTRVRTRFEPPRRPTGSGSPLFGRVPVTTPILMNACNPIRNVSPVASRRPNVSRAFQAM